MLKKCKVIMLPTERAINPKGLVKSINYNNTTGNSDGIIVFSNNTKDDKYNQWISQNIYIISDDKIKIGDYHINVALILKKVIATTDSEVKLPKIPQSFIDKFIEKWNKGEKIEEVMVEYENYEERTNQIGHCDTKLEYYPKLHQDNTIIIHKIKDSWTREEVKQIAKVAYLDAADMYRDRVVLSEQFEEWFEQQDI